MAALKGSDDEFRDGRLAWERQYEKGAFVNQSIHYEIPDIAYQFKAHGIKHVLDHGCGSGRHTVFLAQQGFEVYSLDIAPSGLHSTFQKLAALGFTNNTTLADVLHLPFQDHSFDAIISIRVIHHNRIAVIQHYVEEMWRVLRLHGFIWVTVPVPRGHGSKDGQEIEPGTWVPTQGIEKGLPHHLFTEAELRNLFQHFKIHALQIYSLSHYSLLAEKNQLNT
ncbi:MAG: class I SAM-dependent methyltransferase [Promethearchaeota archaeon]